MGSRSWVYPRPRGEYLRVMEDEGYANGLPPPTRGIPLAPTLEYYDTRSTPAHAGNTVTIRKPR